MIEIVFSDSAGGLLKHAQHYGTGPYNDKGHPAMIYYGVKEKEDGEVRQEAIDAYLKGYHEKERRAWEYAVPLEGKSSDVYDFDLGLSVGDITGDEFSLERLRHIRNVVQPGSGFDVDAYLQKKYQRFRDMSDRAVERIKAGEQVRIWYSHNADEYCGLLWFCWKMRDAGVPLDQVHAVRLPDWYFDEVLNKPVTCAGWGGVETGHVGSLAKSAHLLPESFIRGCASKWDELRQENTPLRAVISGRVISVPEDFYDHLLLQKIEQLHREKGEFGVGRLVGGVMESQIGVWDSWFAYRISKMIEAGFLEVTETAEDGWVYENKLRKAVII